MVWSIAPIYLTMMLFNQFYYKFMKNLLFITISVILLGGCKSFYHPIGMDLKVPEGPREFKAGWHDGCQSALSVAKHMNGRVYRANFGNGIYQHDPMYQTAWAKGWYGCYNLGSTSVAQDPFKNHPAE